MMFLPVSPVQTDQQSVQPSFQYHARKSVVWFEYWYALTLPEGKIAFTIGVELPIITVKNHLS